jgi:hypothetical protein
MIMAPWWVRNALVLDSFVPLSTGSGITRLDGTGGYPLTPAEQTLYNRSTASGQDGAAAVADKRLRDEWQASPASFLNVRMQKAIDVVLWPFFAPETYYYMKSADSSGKLVEVRIGPRTARAPPMLGTLERTTVLYQKVLLLLAGVSLFFVRRNPRLLLVASLPAYAILVHSMVLFIERYFFPAMPAVIVMASSGAWSLWSQVTIRRAARDRETHAGSRLTEESDRLPSAEIAERSRTRMRCVA